MATPKKQVLKKGVTVGPSGVISIANDGAGIAQDTINKVAEHNANITGGKAVSPTTPTPVIPEAPATPTVPAETTVVKTDALKKRIDARKAKGITTPTASTMDTTTGMPVGEKPVVTEPTTTETTPAKETTPPVSETPPVEPKKTEEAVPPVVTPEEQAKLDAESIKAQEDKAKADANKAALALQKSELEKNGKQLVQTQDEAFAVLQAGGKLPKTVDSAKYEAKWKAFQKLNGLSASSLADLNVQGMLTSEMQDTIAKLNPEKWSEVSKKTEDGIKIDGINQSSERIYNKSTGKKTEPTSKSEEMLNDIEKIIKSDKPSIRDLRQKYLLDNEKIKDGAVALAEKDGEIEEIQDEIERTYDDLRGQYPTLPKSMLMGRAATQTKDLNRTLTTKIRERNIIFSEYQANKEEANAMMNFEMQVTKEEREDRAETIKFMQDKFNTLKKDEDWEKEKAYQTEQLKVAYERQDEQAIKAHTRNLEVLDITQKFQKEESRLQREQAWKIVEKQMSGTDWKVTDKGTDADGREFMIKTNDKTGEDKKVYYDEISLPTESIKVNNGNTTVNYSTNKDGEVSVDFDLENGTTLREPQCGQFYNNMTDGEKPVGDSYWSKSLYIDNGGVKAVTDASGKIDLSKVKVGDAFVSSIGVTNKMDKNQYGHIGFVTQKFGDGSIEIQDSNGKGDKKFNKRIIRPGDPMYDTIEGFFSTKLSKDTSSQQTGGKNDITNGYIKDAINNISVKAGAKWSQEGQEKAFLDSIKRNGVGSEQVAGLVNSIIAKDKGAAWGDLRNTVTGMDNIEKLVTEYSQKFGGETFGFSGNLGAKINSITSQLNNSSLPESTKAKLKLQTTILLQLQSYRKAVTGAAASELESKEYVKLFPEGSDSADMTFTKIKALSDEFKRIEAQAQKEYLGGEATYNYIIKGQKDGKSGAATIGDPNFYKPTYPSVFQSYLGGEFRPY